MKDVINEFLFHSFYIFMAFKMFFSRFPLKLNITEHLIMFFYNYLSYFLKSYIRPLYSVGRIFWQFIIARNWLPFAVMVLIYIKQGLVQDYSQRLIEGNIYRQKLSRLKLSRLKPHRARLSRLGSMG